jgi:hypothetical protein
MSDTQQTDTNLYSTINKFASDGLISCYQIQPCEEKKCKPVFIGKYESIPLITHKIIHHENYKMHIITYLLTDEDIKNKIYKIMGIVVFDKEKNDSDHSLDLSFNPDNEKYDLIYSNHKIQNTDIIESLEKLPDDIINYIINSFFMSSLKKLLNKSTHI